MSEPLPATADAPPASPDQDAVLLFLGGPLDGRVEVREARHGAPLPTITHVHLHDGPKVVHHYDLTPLTDQAGVYHLRPSAPAPESGVDAQHDDHQHDDHQHDDHQHDDHQRDDGSETEPDVESA